MIHTIRTVAVGDQESKIDSPIILYRGDREVEVEFPSEIAAYPDGGKPEMYYTTFKNYHELGAQSSGVLVDYPSCKYIMGVVRGVIYSSLGVRAFYLIINGSNIENDMISHDGFEFYIDSYGVKIKNITSNQVSTYLMGVFEVYKF